MAMSLAEITIALLIGGVLSIVYLIYRYVGLVYLKKSYILVQWYGLQCTIIYAPINVMPHPPQVGLWTYRGFTPIN